MASDNSMASQVEDWIVAKIAALADLDSDTIEVYEGTSAPSGQQLVEELIAKASPSRPYVAVLFEGDRSIPLEEGAQAYEPVYAIYVVVKNNRPGAARRGDGTSGLGTNGLRDQLRVVLHGQHPNIGTLGHWTDDTEFRGVQLVYQRKDAFIMRAEVVVRESPTTA